MNGEVVYKETEQEHAAKWKAIRAHRRRKETEMIWSVLWRAAWWVSAADIVVHNIWPWAGPKLVEPAPVLTNSGRIVVAIFVGLLAVCSVFREAGVEQRAHARRQIRRLLNGPRYATPLFEVPIGGDWYIDEREHLMTFSGDKWEDAGEAELLVDTWPRKLDRLDA